jgi:hypothetical protein
MHARTQKTPHEIYFIFHRNNLECFPFLGLLSKLSEFIFDFVIMILVFAYIEAMTDNMSQRLHWVQLPSAAKLIAKWSPTAMR